MKKTHLVLALLLAVSYCSFLAANSAGQSASRFELGGNYTYVRANAGPGSCGCINLQGGSGWIGYNFNSHVAVIGEIAGQHASNIGPLAADLTLTSFLAGVRFRASGSHSFSPFGQFLLGGAHAGGDMAPGNPGIPGSSGAFALTAGGGVDLRISQRFSLRLIQADYFYTHFTNGINDHQNNVRIGAGLVVHFGTR